MFQQDKLFPRSLLCTGEYRTEIHGLVYPPYGADPGGDCQRKTGNLRIRIVAGHILDRNFWHIRENGFPNSCGEYRIQAAAASRRLDSAAQKHLQLLELFRGFIGQFHDAVNSQP